MDEYLKSNSSEPSERSDFERFTDWLLSPVDEAKTNAQSDFERLIDYLSSPPIDSKPIDQKQQKL